MRLRFRNLLYEALTWAAILLLLYACCKCGRAHAMVDVQENKDHATVTNTGVEGGVTGVAPGGVTATVTTAPDTIALKLLTALRSLVTTGTVRVEPSDMFKLTTAPETVKVNATVAPELKGPLMVIEKIENHYHQDAPMVDAKANTTIHGAEKGAVTVHGPTWLMFWLVTGGLALWALVNVFHRHSQARRLPVARDGGSEIPWALKPVAWVLNLFL